MPNELNSELELKANAIEANPIEYSAEPAESSGSGPSVELPSSVELPQGLPQVAGNHKPNCPCRLCERVRARRAAGLPTSAEEKAAKRAAAQTRREARQAKKRKSNATVAAVQASIVTQARLGHRPNAGLAGESAGVSARQGQMVAEANDFVRTALASVGIDDAKLAEVALGGLEAASQRIVTNRDGEIIDVINVPDWKSRHSFWSDLLRVKRILGSDAEAGGGSGGLIIVTPDAAKVLPGHPPACVCEQCRTAWEEKYKHLRRAAMKDSAILTSAVNSQQQDPRAAAIDAEDAEVEEVEYDDFGPVE